MDVGVSIKDSILGFSLARKWFGHSPNWNTAPPALYDLFPLKQRGKPHEII